MHLRSTCLAPALALCALAPVPAAASPPPPLERHAATAPEPGHAFVYLGTCDGSTPALLVEGLPACPELQEAHGTITARVGLVLRDAPSPGAVEVARVSAHASLQLERVHRTDSNATSGMHYYWGEVARPRAAMGANIGITTMAMIGDCNGDRSNCGGCNAVDVLVEPALLVDANCGACDNGNGNNGGSVAPGSEGRPLPCSLTRG